MDLITVGIPSREIERVEKMGKIGKLAALAIVAVGLTFASQAAVADYVMDVVGSSTNGSGLSEDSLYPGDSFVADVVLGSDPASQFDSFGMWVTFDVLGLKYDDYTLGASAFNTRDANDFSDVITTSIGGDPYFSSVSRDGEVFVDGSLVALNLTIPNDPNLVGTVYTIGTEVDFFNDTWYDVVVASGGSLAVTVIPEPMTLALLGIGGVFAIRRRK